MGLLLSNLDNDNLYLLHLLQINTTDEDPNYALGEYILAPPPVYGGSNIKKIYKKLPLVWLRNFAIKYNIKIVKKVNKTDKLLNKNELIDKIIKKYKLK